jgi:hypothetical protein
LFVFLRQDLTMSYYVAQASLEMIVLLSHPTKCWDYRRVYYHTRLAFILDNLNAGHFS